MLVRGEASTKDFASEHRMYNEKVLSYKKIDSTQDVAYRLIKKVIEEETGLFLQFKYPNDLLINKKKVAGLLAETRLKKKRLEFIILGIGININAKGNDLIEGATSLKREKERYY